MGTAIVNGNVSGRFLEDFLRGLARRGVDTDELLAGLPVDRGELQRGHPQVEWDVFVELMLRLDCELGGTRGLRDFGRWAASAKPAAILRRLAGLTASPTTLYKTADRWALRRAIPLLESTFETLRDGRLVVDVAIPEPHRPCPQLLHMAVGTLEAAPQILGLPDAVVSADVQPARARYTVILPSSSTLWARFARAGRALFSARAAFEQLEVQQGELQTRLVELRAAYAVLEESEARHRALAETAVDLVGEISSDGVIQYVSPSVEDILGERPHAVTGTVWEKWVHPDDMPDMAGVFQATFMGSSHGRPVVRMKRRDDQWLWLEVEASSYWTSDGEQRAVVIMRDVSARVRRDAEVRLRQEELEGEVTRRTEQLERRNLELRQLQSLLLQAERLGTAHDLAAQVAHSIGDPLGALIGQLELARRDDTGVSRRIERARTLAERVRDVVNRTLALYREGKVDPTPQLAAEILEDVTKALEGRAVVARAWLRADVDPALADRSFPADRPLLVSALTCIAENALEALFDHGGGELRFEARLLADDDAVEFRLADDGPGVPAELRDRIFDPFFTTKRTGAGLGLAIARGVVQGHDGEIAVEDRPGGGSLVRVTLPASSPR